MKKYFFFRLTDWLQLVNIEAVKKVKLVMSLCLLQIIHINNRCPIIMTSLVKVVFFEIKTNI